MHPFINRKRLKHPHSLHHINIITTFTAPSHHHPASSFPTVDEEKKEREFVPTKLIPKNSP